MRTYQIERVVNAPVDIVWRVIADLERYGEFAPNLEKAELSPGQGVGVKRRCTDIQGERWIEECVLWDEGHKYAMQIDPVSYPYPILHMKGTWTVEKRDEGTAIIMEFEYQPKFDPPIIGALSNRLMLRPSIDQSSHKLLDNWEAEILRLAGEQEETG